MRWILALTLATGAYGQQIDLNMLDKLASRAKSSVNVSLDEAKLKLASAFLSTEDETQSAAKGLVGGLRAVNVRVFEFDQANAFSATDLDGIRAQLRSPGWSKMVEARDGDEIAEVYIFSKGKDFGGLTVIAGEAKELAVVNIVGPVDLKTLGSLAGSFGIPKDFMSGGSAPKPGPVKPPSSKKPAAPKQD